MTVESRDDPDFDRITPKPVPGRRFTLIELLVILGIIAILIALLIPARRGAPNAARRAQCVNNLKQIALALHNYEQTYNCLPPAHTVDAQGRPLHSWRTLILPYLEQDQLYKTIDLSKPWDDPANAKARETSVPVFQCPSASTGPSNMTTYLAIVAPGSCFLPETSRRLAEIADGQSSTLMLIEAGEEQAIPWMAPTDADMALVVGLGQGSGLHHSGGTNACTVDGYVHFLKASTPADVRRALVTISGDEKVSADAW